MSRALWVTWSMSSRVFLVVSMCRSAMMKKLSYSPVQLHPVGDAADVVAEVQLPGRAVTGEHPCCGHGGTPFVPRRTVGGRAGARRDPGCARISGVGSSEREPPSPAGAEPQPTGTENVEDLLPTVVDAERENRRGSHRETVEGLRGADARPDHGSTVTGPRPGREPGRP